MHAKYDRRPAPRVSATTRLDTLATAIGYTVIASAVIGAFVWMALIVFGVVA